MFHEVVRAYKKGGRMALEKEMATYKAKLAEWPEHEGKFVLIHEDQVVDFFSSYDDAIKDGYRRYGLNPFLVKQVRSVEVAQVATRLLEPHTLSA
jgi:hypothetical protein